MSKGPGKMQRMILERLANRPGGDAIGPAVQLKPGWHDFRKVLRELAREQGAICRGLYVEESFRASFSRAVRSLVKARRIQCPESVPTIHIYEPINKEGFCRCLFNQRRFGSLL